jgi:hypothetical protein
MIPLSHQRRTVASLQTPRDTIVAHNFPAVTSVTQNKRIQVRKRSFFNNL